MTGYRSFKFFRMRKALFFSLLVLLSLVSFKVQSQATNPLIVPDTLMGPDFNIELKDTTHQFFPGRPTNTYTYSPTNLESATNPSYLGPTLIFRKGDFITLNVTNNLPGATDTTTTHWHGMHVAPVDDGGPHTKINPGATWSPDFTILDEAGTYWYHPHLHTKTTEHVFRGCAGMIIVEDTNSDALTIPKTYGVDDFPFIIQDKTFKGDNQYDIPGSGIRDIGDEIIVNGTIDPYLEVHQQMIRLRVLNASNQRSYNLGLRNNGNFRMISSDGGFLEAPLTMNRLLISPGERADIVIDFSPLTVGDTISLRSYGNELVTGGISGTPGGLASDPLSPNHNFNVIEFRVIAPTVSPVTSLSGTLNTFTKPLEADANAFRTKEMTRDGATWTINDEEFDHDVVNDMVILDDIEVWTLTNSTTGVAHPFHIHDMQFFILDIDGAAPPAYLAGRKDVVMVEPSQTVRFITQFKDFTDDVIPYMYHCHILPHEDGAMMGQFVVSSGLLPVDLSYFRGKEFNESSLLEWETISELNNDGFYIQKSLDGVKFDDIGFVRGHSTTQERHAYNFIDRNFVQDCFYRLKQVDYDGRMEFSNVVLVTKSHTVFGEFATIYPNPLTSSSQLTFGISNARDLVFGMNILDPLGHSLLTTNGNPEKLTMELRNLSPTLKAGIYVCELRLGKSLHYLKFIVN